MDKGKSTERISMCLASCATIPKLRLRLPPSFMNSMGGSLIPIVVFGMGMAFPG